MKKLFLTASFCDVAQYLPEFFGDSLEGKTVTFVPTASLVEEYSGYVDDDREAFLHLGITIDELHIEQETTEIIRKKLSENDLIYVSGGNTFYLLQELKKSGVDQLIIEHVKAGKLYIGASAGSIILSKNIAYFTQVDDKSLAPYLTDDEGLGIVDFYPLPHYKSEPFAEIIDQVYDLYSKKISLVPISNSQVIQVKGDAYAVKGAIL